MNQKQSQNKQSQTGTIGPEFFDFNPYLQELLDIVKNDNFIDITDQPNYFENRFQEKILKKEE